MARIKALIRSGDTYQVNYTYRLRTPFTGNPWNFFLRLVAAQDPPYGAFLDTGEWVICSASPELFFRLDGARIECRPMKGTAARGRTQAEDLAQAQALQASEKERAENVMIVDMVRHDLGRVAQTGSVKVARLFEVERYPTLWQMTSTIEARPKPGWAKSSGRSFRRPRSPGRRRCGRCRSSPSWSGSRGASTPGRLGSLPRVGAPNSTWPSAPCS